MRGSFKRERHLEGQQERRVQREDEKESRARWSYVQSSEEGCGCFVSSYRLRVICLPQLCHPAVTHCYAPLCPGILALGSLCPLLSACVCVCCTFVSRYDWRLLAWKWANQVIYAAWTNMRVSPCPLLTSSWILAISQDHQKIHLVRLQVMH